MLGQLKLTHFKCFGSQVFDFGDLTLLCGRNGLGKSTMIQALLLLRQSHSQGLLARGELALNGDLVRLGTAADALYEAAEDDVIGVDLITRAGSRGSWRFVAARGEDVLRLQPGFAGTAPDLRGLSLLGDDFHYLRAERVGPRGSHPTSDYAVREHRQIGADGAYATHYLVQFGDQPVQNQAVVHPNADSRRLGAQVEAWLGEIIPGVRLHYRLHAGLDEVALTYSFVQHQTVTREYRPANVGFGVSYVLPVVLSLVAALPGSLVILENPEAHLDPRGQAEVGRLAALASKGGVQVIAETHSDHVVNAVRVAVRRNDVCPASVRVLFFSPGPNGRVPPSVVVPRIDHNGRLDTWPEGFFDEWDRSLSALL
ncbi:MAG: DUF3696 domain-containing protein [Armatimonadetes bacterium]|nr:DUF3696 domain-containing protein [Armatimonadota bacterium]